MVETSSSTPPGVHCVSSAKLAHFLKREQRASSVTELDLDRIFRELLQRANDFLPSEARTIYLDDPLDVHEDGGRLSLVVIAGFGPKSEDLMEERFSTAMGIIGEVYRTGQPYSCSEPLADPIFRSGPGLRIGFTIESVVGAPIEVEGRTIGVIELINHSSGQGYSEADLALLGIFAQTISLSVVNAIDAQRAKEIAKRDELTELYNDRYLHGSLSKIIDEAVASGSECGIIFLDLDHFKEVNDTHGHLVGSQLLSKVGATLKQIIPGEGLAARYGGEGRSRHGGGGTGSPHRRRHHLLDRDRDAAVGHHARAQRGEWRRQKGQGPAPQKSRHVHVRGQGARAESHHPLLGARASPRDWHRGVAALRQPQPALECREDPVWFLGSPPREPAEV
jgi:GAF domain-containing protein